MRDASAFLLVAVTLVARVFCYSVADFEAAPPLVEFNATGDLHTHITHKAAFLLETTGNFLDFSFHAVYDSRKFKIVHLQRDHSLNKSSVSLNPETGEITLSKASAGTHSMLTGGRTAHSLDNTDDQPKVVLVGRDRDGRMLSHAVRKSTMISRSGEKEDIHVTTEFLTLHQIYRHTQLHLRTNILPNTFVPNPELENERRKDGASKLDFYEGCCYYCVVCGLSHAASDVCNAVVHVASDITSVVDGVVTVIKALVTGSLSESGSQFLYGESLTASGVSSSSSSGATGAFFHRQTQQIGNAEVTATANFGVTLDYHVIINNYALINVTAILSSTLDLNATATFSSQATSGFVQEILLGTIEFDSIDLSAVGVPISVTPTIPVHVGARASFSEAVTAYASAHCVITLVSGFVYAMNDQGTLVFQPVHSYSKDTGYSYSYSVAVAALFHVWVSPTLMLNTDYFGGPFVNVKVSAELVLAATSEGAASTSTSADSSSSAPQPPAVALGVNVNIVALVTLGAKIGIDAPDLHYLHTFGPILVLNLNIPLLSKIVSLSSSSENKKMGYGLPVLPRISPSGEMCPPQEQWPVSAYIGQVLMGPLTVFPDNILNIISGVVSLKFVAAAATPVYDAAPNITVRMLCAISGMFLDSLNTVQYWSQQNYCVYYESVSNPGWIDFVATDDHSASYLNTTSSEGPPDFPFFFYGAPAPSDCDVTSFLLVSFIGNSTMNATVSGAPSG